MYQKSQYLETVTKTCHGVVPSFCEYESEQNLISKSKNDHTQKEVPVSEPRVQGNQKDQGQQVQCETDCQQNTCK